MINVLLTKCLEGNVPSSQNHFNQIVAVQQIKKNSFPDQPFAQQADSTKSHSHIKTNGVRLTMLWMP